MAEPERIQSSTEIVRDVGGSAWSDFWKKEDYWAIWMGFAILIVGILIFLPQSQWRQEMGKKMDASNATLKKEAAGAPFKTIAWHQASDAKRGLRGTNEAFAKQIQEFVSAPSRWLYNPVDALYRSKEVADAMNAAAKPAFDKAKGEADAALVKAKATEKAAETAGFKDTALNKKAEEAIAAWQSAEQKASSAKRKVGNKPFNRVPYLIGFAVILALFFSIGQMVLGNKFLTFIMGFFVVFILAVLSYMGEQQETMNYWGFGFPLWAIVLGMLISNTVGTPKWLKSAAQTEYYIKTGLVLLGAEILLNKIVTIGQPGIFIAWVVTPIVLIFTYWLGQKVIKIPSKTLNITISADLSVCGVSAAIATAAACRAKKSELTVAVGLSMCFAAVMMVVMPAFIKAVGMNPILGGAWIGGTIDATGAVAAAGAFLGDKALYTAATIKMIQNILIGFTAFGVALYWTTRVERVAGEKVSWWEIWHRFPKFVLGFMGASIIFSILDDSMGKDLSAAVVDHGILRGFTRLLREWFFALAFVSIGLETNFRELREHFTGGKPFILYFFGQCFDLSLTLFMCWLMFYVVFPDVMGRL